MNKFAAESLLIEAASGRAVVVVSQQAGISHEVFRDYFAPVAELSGAVKEIRRARGAEQVRFESGGTLRCLALGSQLRGVTGDVVFLDWPVDAQPGAFDQALLVIAGREGGEIHRA